MASLVTNNPATGIVIKTDVETDTSSLLHSDPGNSLSNGASRAASANGGGSGANSSSASGHEIEIYKRYSTTTPRTPTTGGLNVMKLWIYCGIGFVIWVTILSITLLVYIIVARNVDEENDRSNEEFEWIMTVRPSRSEDENADITHELVRRFG